MVTPNLPPDQAANALLPQLLRDGLSREGHEVRLLSFEPREGRLRQSDVRYIRRPRNGLARTLRLSSIETGLSVWRESRAFFEGADVVHVHSNTFMNQAAAFLAQRRGLPFILTHYGTEIWHYRKRALDPFLWMNESASTVTYYSRLLLERSLELGVVPRKPVVVYPPVDERFQPPTPGAKREARRALGIGDGPVLLNVKRLHPLAGQTFLVEAMPEILRRHPKARLFIAGEGEARKDLESRIASLGLARAVTLPGLVDNRELPRYYHASDLFVLPSKLEAFPTVAAEALASGLRVVSADHPGGIELQGLFPEDVDLVPKEQSGPLALAIVEALSRESSSSAKTRERIERELRPKAAIETYLAIYRSAIHGDAVAGD
ncbi:MAG TPA: glycosyltransferase family 4 protein [Vicinamibacteria bacterium]|nr:glycosyltransferase family 4 protein [Vicinamibacteria bacterium]